MSLPEQLGFFDMIIHNWLYPSAEKCNAIVSLAESADILSEGSSGVQLCSGMHLYSPRVFDLPSIPLLSFHVHAFFRMVHALPLRPFLPTSVLLSQPCILLLPLFLMWPLQSSFLWQRQAVVFLRWSLSSRCPHQLCWSSGSHSSEKPEPCHFYK